MNTEHHFVGNAGELYDTRVHLWSRCEPLRPNYSRTHREINSVADFKATLRAGAYAWPGGYQLFLITSDGSTLSFDGARAELRNIIDSIQTNANDGWRVVACDINYEDSDMYCAHTNKLIPAAYGD